MAGYGLINPASFFISHSFIGKIKKDDPNKGKKTILFVVTSLAIQTVALELLNYYGPDSRKIRQKTFY